MSGICSLTDTEKCYEQRGEILKVSAVRARLKELKNCLGLLAYRKHLFIPMERATVQYNNFAWGKKKKKKA